jgi:hypothetical protein
LIGFLKKMDAESPDDFIEFAINDPALAEKKIIAFLSSERSRADRGEISAGTINNWVKATRLFLEMSDVQLNWKLEKMGFTQLCYSHTKSIKKVMNCSDVNFAKQYLCTKIHCMSNHMIAKLLT